MEEGPVSNESGVTTQESKEEELDTLLLGNNKNNLIVNYLFKLFI